MMIYTQEFAEQATKLMDGVREEFWARCLGNIPNEKDIELGRTQDDTWGKTSNDYDGL
jgi:hypothetical protein